MSNLLRPMNCSPLVASVHGVSQARILEWAAISFSRGSTQGSNLHLLGLLLGRQTLYQWAQRHIRMYLYHFAVHWKPTQQHKSTLPQLKKKNPSSKVHEFKIFLNNPSTRHQSVSDRDDYETIRKPWFLQKKMVVLDISTFQFCITFK